MRVSNNPLDIETTLKIEKTVGSKIVSVTSLIGGCVCDVKRVVIEDDREFVAKISKTGKDHLQIEGYMLKYLKDKTELPTSNVFYCDDKLLLVEYIVVDSDNKSKSFEKTAAQALAKLHNITDDDYGFDMDTVVGGLIQPNNKNKDWIEFFRDNRLIYMAKQAHDSGSLPDSVYKKIEKLADNLYKYLDAPLRPSLIHGDVWTGNVLCKDGKLAAFIDPAIYFADNEMEFTFATVWNSFGETFFNTYNEINPIRADYFEVRRHIYNLYPLLVHTKLFGTSYAMAVDSTVSKFI
jgi:fructosamine-3-kinase